MGATRKNMLDVFAEIDATLDTLRATDSRAQKIAVLQGMSHGARELFRQFARRALSPFEAYYVNTQKLCVPDVASSELTAPNEWANDFHFILDGLQRRRLHERHLVNFLSRTPNEIYDFAVCVIAKDFSAGLGTQTVNAAFPDCVPSFKVQLCKKYKQGTSFEKPVHAQGKVDGVRCIMHKGVARSRAGREFNALRPFAQQLAQKFPYRTFDGEVFAGNYEGSVSVVRGTKPMSQGMYHVFDGLPSDDFERGLCMLDYETRWETLCTWERRGVFQGFSMDMRQPLSFGVMFDAEAVNGALHEALDSGYEGLVLKGLSDWYDFRRSKAWLKYTVDAHEEDFTIVGCELHEHGDKLGRITCEVKKDGQQFGVGTGFTDWQRINLWQRREELVGKLATVRFREWTRNGVPRFPVFKRLRAEA